MAQRRKKNQADTSRHKGGVPAKGTVPGVSPNPATNLIMADIAIRAGSYLVRNSVEKTMLRGRYGKDATRNILENRSIKQNLAAFAAAKMATRSVPGAVAVGGGILLKTLFDMSQKRRARRKGREQLRESAESED
ncbi:hypothetical protein [Parerythrobacter jejuensis]|uniref:Uncharacterized protein n=1 Tax=Parerythrobacter jejuensis TaxID=795812 RepID=A0A845ARV5_9SPHN|nr:hypothetical protein [Parerythrobacter jejuensis]MXP30290.1 hypothetical protein [Parerythrobacter jejuensis]MXP33050.1 hypothetical protein [Parerythrobacter jejuensis]